MVEFEHPELGTVEAEDVDFESPEEKWRDYELEDGTTLRVKTVVNKVFRIKDMYNELGEPVYQIGTQNMVRATDIPEELRGDMDPENLSGGSGMLSTDSEASMGENEGEQG
jgi:hypothetical protein